MTAKEWLSRARNIDKYINSLTEEQSEVFRRITSATAPLGGERVQTNGGNRTERLLIKYAEYGETINKQIDRLVEVKKEIAEAISKVDDYALCTLLTDRYIRFMTWEQIAAHMNYSYVHVVHRLHPRALQRISGIIDG